ncbi:hypothetical protein EG68_07535 [Paragonimus skrjabini miyazakii]|uniref:Uncharacterized protein n=1 Tax=Paragonimus skrjabini miyazakii TaxID=59628 RepID=A0A8S9YLN5_9TREM|nr:hypothetical protein EG68_07535 [Paragonimus skrjabini miyazakii]
MPRVSASAVAVICLVDLTQTLNSHRTIFSSDPKIDLAVLVTDKSDVCHTYHILTGLGIPRENIITFMYGDIANNRK